MSVQETSALPCERGLDALRSGLMSRSGSLFGVTSVQATVYFRNYASDSAKWKCAVRSRKHCS